MRNRIAHLSRARLGLALSMLTPSLMLAADGRPDQSPGNASHEHFDRLRQILTALKHDVTTAPMDDASVSNSAAEIDRLIGEVDEMILKPEALMEGSVAAGVLPQSCFVPAEAAQLWLFHSTISFLADGAFEITLIGNQGMHQFAMTQTQTVSETMAQINAHAAQTGVQAVSFLSGGVLLDLLKLVSTVGGHDQYVVAFVSSEPLPIFHSVTGGGPSQSGLVDYGLAAVVPWTASP